MNAAWEIAGHRVKLGQHDPTLSLCAGRTCPAWSLPNLWTPEALRCRVDQGNDRPDIDRKEGLDGVSIFVGLSRTAPLPGDPRWELAAAALEVLAGPDIPGETPDDYFCLYVNTPAAGE